MRTLEQWLNDFTHPCYKENKYECHPHGCMVTKPNKKEVVCFYPILSKDGVVLSFIVNTYRVKYLDDNTWFRECSFYNFAENCIRHRWYITLTRRIRFIASIQKRNKNKSYERTKRIDSISQ